MAGMGCSLTKPVFRALLISSLSTEPIIDPNRNENSILEVLDRRYSAKPSFQADGRRCCANGMLLHGAFKNEWVDVSGACVGWSELNDSNFSVDA